MRRAPLRSIRTLLEFSSVNVVAPVFADFPSAAMETKKWICKNGAQTIALTFDQRDENVTYRLCPDKKCNAAESGNAKLSSSVGTHYLFNIAGSKTEERFTISFSENAKAGVIPEDGKILSVEKGTNNSSDPLEKFEQCKPARM